MNFSNKAMNRTLRDAPRRLWLTFEDEKKEMSILTDIILQVISHLPKLFSWWLYKPKRTTEHLSIDVSAQEGSVEIWCDKSQARFSMIVQIRNGNPFDIEIDRAEVSARLHMGQLKASNFFGAKVQKGKVESLRLEGRIDDQNLRYVNEAPNGEHLAADIRAIVVNKYHTIRTFNRQFDRLMCRMINKRIEQGTREDRAT